MRKTRLRAYAVGTMVLLGLLGMSLEALENRCSRSSLIQNPGPLVKGRIIFDGIRQQQPLAVHFSHL
jgi:hypothetical protein